MKKLLFTTIAIVLSIYSFAETTEKPVSEKELFEIQQTSNWEYLGKISATYQLGTSGFDLYVKVISGKEFYQVRKGANSYAVIIGRYTCQGKNFNATFKEGEN